MEKVAVLGSGVMGSAIAAHFANAGVPSLVLDIVPKEPNKKEQAAGLTLESPKVRNRIAAESVRALAKARPSPIYAAWRMGMIEVGNFEDDLPRLAEADWVIEAVKEDMGIKKKVLQSAASHLGPDALLSTNTSGLSLNALAEALPEDVRKRFVGTHFFNPPRYMKLLELIPARQTSPEVMQWVTSFSNERLGKGVVPAKDTPNFIANRIGVHSMMTVLRLVQELGLTIEEVDAITGPALGRPKTATFKLADLVGLDTLLFVAHTVCEGAPNDESRETFVAPEFFVKMVKGGMLGRKSGAGFYKKVKKDILALDLDKLDYRAQVKPSFPEMKALKGIDDAGQRVRTLVDGEGRAAELAWKFLAPTLSYAALRLGEIADDASTIDRAIELGFNWELGPFALWDALGFRKTTERLRADGYPLPGWIDALYDTGAESLYADKQGVRHSPTSKPGATAPVFSDPMAVSFAALHEAKREVKTNPSASLIDLGDNVLGLEFHSKMNAVDGQIVEMIDAAVAEAEQNWEAIVVANDGVNFCAGANLMMLAQLAMKQDWKGISNMVVAFQSALDRMEQCAVPVVVAPHGLALGGGAEIVLAGNKIQAAAESYIGLVEVGAGLLPAGGGCLRLYRRHVRNLDDPKDPYPALRTTFETIGMAKASTSAEEALGLGFLGTGDGWSMNGDHRVAAAKATALAMARAGYVPPRPTPIATMGRNGIALIESALFNMFDGQFISAHDRKIGREIARVLSGGDVAGPTSVSEQTILDLERESFLRLCGEPKTHERIESLLKTGKPLRN
jgi:3-hydroxyacyl-CoA dehydrogenase